MKGRRIPRHQRKAARVGLEQNRTVFTPGSAAWPEGTAGVFKNPEFLRYLCAPPMCGYSRVAERDVYLFALFPVPLFTR